MDWTFSKRLGLGFSLAVVTVLVIGLVGFRSTRNLVEQNAWVAHTEQVRLELAALHSELKDIEAAVRGFAIVGDETFLTPFSEAETSANAYLTKLEKLVSDNPHQVQRLVRVRPLVIARLAAAEEVVVARRSQGAQASAQVVVAGKGKALMDQLRTLLHEMDQEEVSLLDRRQLEATAAARNAENAILWGSFAGILIVTLVGWFIARSLTGQIGHAVRHIQSSSTELQAAANQQATGAKEQATAMSEITTTISELLATSRQIAESARRVSDISERTAVATRTGDLTVKRGNDTMQSIKRQVDAVVTHMLELGKKSQHIGSVVDIVSELAEQTNILAINATIEAVGAGEAGKRFGVVADEIRKLADRVAGSAKEIRALIDDVQRATNTTIMTTETGSKAVEAGAEQFARVAVSFSDISSEVLTTNQAAKEIELSTKQQSTAVEQVNSAITSVAQASKESEVSTGQTLRTASELSALSRELLRIVQPNVELGAPKQNRTTAHG